MNYLELLIDRYPELSDMFDPLETAVGAILFTHTYGGKILLAGNGGSAADCEHISGELLKGFMSKRALSEEKRRKMREGYPIEDSVLDELQMGLAAIPLPSLSSASLFHSIS